MNNNDAILNICNQCICYSCSRNSYCTMKTCDDCDALDTMDTMYIHQYCRDYTNDNFYTQIKETWNDKK